MYLVWCSSGESQTRSQTETNLKRSHISFLVSCDMFPKKNRCALKKNAPRLIERRAMLTILFVITACRFIFLREVSALSLRKLDKSPESLL